MTILVTGAAGFIGFHVSKALLARGETVIGLDSITPYYDVRLKHARLEQLSDYPGFSFRLADVSDEAALLALADEPAGEEITGIIHLAAQAGVRYSLENPLAYIEANVRGQVVMLEAARRMPALEHFVYASSSSVYGGNTKQPYSVEDPVEKPVSLYAATKRSGELISYTYAHLYGIPQTGLRFFTVYGPWGRPDMAYFSFTEAILAGEPIEIFGADPMARDFTYIDDIVKGILAALDHPPVPATADDVPHRVYNLGNREPRRVGELIAGIESALGIKAEIRVGSRRAGDVTATFADIESSQRDLGFSPEIGLEEGLRRFVAWYREYHQA